jgi:hypothetical protein
VAELVDAVDSKSTGSNPMRVRLSPSALRIGSALRHPASLFFQKSPRNTLFLPGADFQAEICDVTLTCFAETGEKYGNDR